jgi:transcriptional regulator NrdR family protein
MSDLPVCFTSRPACPSCAGELLHRLRSFLSEADGSRRRRWFCLDCREVFLEVETASEDFLNDRLPRSGRDF